MFRDLHFVLTFLRDFITEHELLKLYQELSQSVQQTAQATEEAAESLDSQIEEQIKQVKDAHLNVNLLIWTPPQIAILKHLGGHQIIGKKAVKRIERAFETRGGNSAKIVQDINTIREETNVLSQRVTQSLTNFNFDEYAPEEDTEQTLVEIAFKKNAAFTNFWETQNRAGDWSFVFQAFTQLTGEKYEDIKTVSWNSASPEVGVWLALGKKTGEALIFAAKVVSSLKVIKDTIFKKKKILTEEVGAEGKELKMVFEQVRVKHDKQYEMEIGKAVVELRQTYGQNSTRPQGDGDNQISMAINRMVDLLTDGARVIDPQEVLPVVEKDKSTLSKSYSSNLQLEKQIKPYLAAEERKRLEARTKLMKKELGLGIENNEGKKYTVKELKTNLKKAKLEFSGNKPELLRRWLDYSSKQDKHDEESSPEVQEIKEGPKKGEKNKVNKGKKTDN